MEERRYILVRLSGLKMRRFHDVPGDVKFESAKQAVRDA